MCDAIKIREICICMRLNPNIMDVKRVTFAKRCTHIKTVDSWAKYVQFRNLSLGTKKRRDIFVSCGQGRFCVMSNERHDFYVNWM